MAYGERGKLWQKKKKNNHFYKANAPGKFWNLGDFLRSRALCYSFHLQNPKEHALRIESTTIFPEK